MPFFHLIALIVDARHMARGLLLPLPIKARHTISHRPPSPLGRADDGHRPSNSRDMSIRPRCGQTPRSHRTPPEPPPLFRGKAVGGIQRPDPNHPTRNCLQAEGGPNHRTCLLFTMTSRTSAPAAPSGEPAAKPFFHSRMFITNPSATHTVTLFSRRDGGARRDRTDDLMLAKHALSQLSYGPFEDQRIAVGSRLVGPDRAASIQWDRCGSDKTWKTSSPPRLRSPRLVGLSGLEPLTSRLSGVCSNHLSYKPQPCRPGTRMRSQA